MQENKPNLEQVNKPDRMEIRKQIASRLFLLGQVAIRNGQENTSTDIRMGEVQSVELMQSVKNLLDDTSFWAALPEQKEFVFSLHGANYTETFDKQALFNELAILVEQHESLN